MRNFIGIHCIARQAEGALRKGVVRGVSGSGAAWFKTCSISLDDGLSWEELPKAETQHFEAGRLFWEEDDASRSAVV